MRERSRFLALLGVFAILGTVYSLITPLFEAPDEVWHYAYARYLAEKRALPSWTNDESGAYQEVTQPPFYYAVVALVSGAAPDDDLATLMWHNPGFGYQAGGTVNDNKNMLIHTDRERFPWSGAALAIHLARFVSVAFGMATVAAAWGLGRETFPRRPSAALSAAALVAFMPQFLFISGVVNNDSAAAATTTAALWAIARIVRRGPTLKRSIAAGLLIGLAALTKTSALLLWPLALAALALPRRPSRTRARDLCAVTGAGLAVSGGWYLRNALLYRDPLGLRVHADTPWGWQTPPTLAKLLFEELPKVYRTFWGGFGWGHVQFPPWVYLIFGVFLLASLVGWGAMLLAKRPLEGSKPALLLAAAWWTLVFAALIQWMRQVEAAHGRLLFPAIGAGAALMVAGWSGLPRRCLRWTRLVFLAGLATLSLTTPWVIIHPAFAPPRLLTPEQAAATVEPKDILYGDVARLIGVALDTPSVAPGDQASLRACWEAVAPIETDYTVFVHLVGPNNTRIAERHTYPGLGRFPTSLWPVGRAFCDTYRLRVEDWAPVPELYDVAIGLFDAATGERLPSRSSAGEAIAFPAVTQVRVAPRQPLSVQPEHPLDIRLGGQIALIGYDLSGAAQDSTALTVTLYWRADAPPTGDYTVFVHLLDAEGRPLAQHDGKPRNGRYPTLAWHTGDIVPDAHRLEIPTALADHRPSLGVGMYHSATLERLPAVGPAGPIRDNLIPLPLDSQ